MTFSVPIPELPSWVAITWTPTFSAAVVECGRCRAADAIYTTVLRRDPDALARAVDGHEGCTP